MARKNRIFRMSPLEDKLGKYYPVCEYPAHKGIIKINEYKRCERRHCKYYIKLYLEKNAKKNNHQSFHCNYNFNDHGKYINEGNHRKNDGNTTK